MIDETNTIHDWSLICLFSGKLLYDNEINERYDFQYLNLIYKWNMKDW